MEFHINANGHDIDVTYNGVSTLIFLDGKLEATIQEDEGSVSAIQRLMKIFGRCYEEHHG